MAQGSKSAGGSPSERRAHPSRSQEAHGASAVQSYLGLVPGESSIDTDAVAARVAAHPWVASAQVRRELPSVLVIDVTERRAAAVALLGRLYLVDETGRPFKRATLEEAEGLVVLTGITREQYSSLRSATESAYREALALATQYRGEDPLVAGAARSKPEGTGEGGSGRVGRPPLSEVHIDPRAGFSLHLHEGGGEIRLGRGDHAEKLGRLDQILAALGPGGLPALRTVHLDGATRDRVPVRLAAAAAAATGVSAVTAVRTEPPPGRR